VAQALGAARRWRQGCGMGGAVPLPHLGRDPKTPLAVPYLHTDFCHGFPDIYTRLRRHKSMLLVSVEQTGGYCWSFNFHATQLLLLRWILKVLGLQ